MPGLCLVTIHLVVDPATACQETPWAGHVSASASFLLVVTQVGTPQSTVGYPVGLRQVAAVQEFPSNRALTSDGLPHAGAVEPL